MDCRLEKYGWHWKPRAEMTRRTSVMGLLVASLLCLTCDRLWAGPITFQQTGYSINVLDAGPAKTGSQAALQMFLPARDGFASNVNVQHQAFDGDVGRYAELTKAQFEQLGWTMVYEKVGPNHYAVEGFGQVGKLEQMLYFYIRAIKSGDNIILATATTPQKRWQEDKDILIPIVDSLQPNH